MARDILRISNTLAFAMQQCLQECPSQLQYMYTASQAADLRSFSFNSIIILKQIQFLPLTLVSSSEI
jgi:hypothetical protein